jgi:hypothetical protein
MELLLVIFMLKVESSYLQNVERASSLGSTDTVQFVLADGHAWRIKTFAIDHDVHVWNIGPMPAERLVALARSNTAKNYGDVLGRTIVVKSSDGFDGLKAELSRYGLPANLEISKSGSFAFWTQEAGLYETRSTPQ